MGWNGLEIKGHSGTQFKHNKGFAKRARAVQQQLRTQGATGTQEYRPDDREKKEYPHWIYATLAILAGLSLAVFTYQIFFQTSVTIAQEAKELQVTQAYKNSIDYENLIRMSKASFYRGAIPVAIEDYERATRVNSSGWEAQWGLLLAYTKSCSTTTLNCNKAKKQLVFCKRLLNTGQIKGEKFQRELEEIQLFLGD